MRAAISRFFTRLITRRQRPVIRPITPVFLGGNFSPVSRDVPTVKIRRPRQRHFRRAGTLQRRRRAELHARRRNMGQHPKYGCAA